MGIVCYPTFGGSGIVATELGMELAKKGNEIHFFSYSLPARLNTTLPNIFFHRVTIENYPLFQYQPYDLALSTSIVDVAKKIGLDLVHVHYAIPHAYAAYMSKKMLEEENIKLPIITTLHGTDITLVGQYPGYKSAVEFSINQSDAVTSVSESLKKDTHKTFQIKKEIQVIPNFIDNSLFSSVEPPLLCLRSNFAEKEEKILIHVSNLRKVKRIEDVIEIFYRVQKEVSSQLIIVGEGPEWNNAEKLVVKYGLSDRVKSVGWLRNLYSILRLSDLFILPSAEESFGLAALEAMAAGLPVISSNAGGLPEVNINNVTGYTFNVGDVDKMAKAAISLLKNEKMLNQFKQNAKEQAQKFDIKNVLFKYENLYKEVLNESN
ncbi:MAG: N-acetyl-alpha-D-glucosaminyl L-malate synthase BshA [Solirubrobacteraceae bacterium]